MAILRKDTLAVIMTGTTHAIDMGGKTAFIHYADETTARMRLPDGTRYDGRWSLLGDGYRVEWDNGPAGTWKLDHQPGTIDYLDETGTARGRITRIEFGPLESQFA